MHRKLHKHGRRSYLSVGTFGDSQSFLEREPLRSKDRGLFSYNIDTRHVFTRSRSWLCSKLPAMRSVGDIALNPSLRKKISLKCFTVSYYFYLQIVPFDLHVQYKIDNALIGINSVIG